MVASATPNSRLFSRQTVALNNTEQRRILLATTLTFLALPALWWANQSEGASAPNIATVGVAVGIEGGPASGSASESSASAAAGANQLGKADPVFLGGPAGDAGGAPEIAVPAAPQRESVTISATFTSNLPDAT